MERLRRDRRTWVAIVALSAAVTVALVGCGDGGTEDEPARGDVIKEVAVATHGGDFRGVIDAAPGPDGRRVYFTATGSAGPGVFGVPAAGGQAAPVVTGPPFEAPAGVAVGTDGVRLFVADAEATTPSGKGGAVFAVEVAGGRPAPVPGTEGKAPRGVEVVAVDGEEVLYFTGRDDDGTPGVFHVPVRGGSPTAVVRGAPLASPDAVTATRAGVVFVTDRGDTAGRGGVYRVAGGSVEWIAELRAPHLAGLALTRDESTLLVSALSEAGTDQVLVIDVPTLRSGVFSETIGENREGGGLHRAHDVDVFAWADLVAGPDRSGRVYVLRP